MAAMARFVPCGVITLTTDFGLADPFVGVMKGRILGRFAAARIVDLSHAAPVGEPEVAGFWLARCFEQFPPGTVHAAVVDPGVGTERAIVGLMSRGHVLLAPDNGLLAAAAARDPGAEAVRLAPRTLAGLAIEAVSATFHGRDIFAPLAAEIAAGRLSPQALGPPLGEWTRTERDEPLKRADSIEGRVLVVDHFGNLITNIEAASLAGFEAPRAHVGGRVLPIRRTYADVATGELLALVNSFEVLEIAVGQGSAAAKLGLGRGARVSVRQAVSADLLAGPNRL